MLVVVETKKLGPISIEVAVATTLSGLVQQYGEKAVYAAAVTERSLIDRVRDFVRGAIARGVKDAGVIAAEAAEVRLLPPTTRTAEEIQALLAKLSESPDDDLAIALESMTQEQKDALVARLVS